jgi:hypothetical protein
MSSRPVIHKVICRWGLVDDPTDWRELKTTVIGRDELSGEVVDAIFDNDLPLITTLRKCTFNPTSPSEARNRTIFMILLLQPQLSLYRIQVFQHSFLGSFFFSPVFCKVP